MLKKTVLITGASSGIGAETARQFAKYGYNVAINYSKSEEQAFFLERELNDLYKTDKIIAKAIKADVSDEKQVKTMFSICEKIFNKVDVLINNAAISEQKMLCDTTKNEFDRMFNINIGGVFLCSREAIKSMVKEKSGKIINISSMWGECGASCEVVYSSSKAAVIGFTKALAKELGPSNITVNCITPGVIDTPMNKNLNDKDIKTLREETPLGRIGMPIDIAKTILFLAENGDFITGQIIGVNGGILI